MTITADGANLKRGDILVVGGVRYKVTRVFSDRLFEVRRTFGQWVRDTWRLWTWRRKS